MTRKQGKRKNHAKELLLAFFRGLWGVSCIPKEVNGQETKRGNISFLILRCI